MSGSKPTLGYPSRTAAVLALRARKLSTGAIAQLVGVENKTVAALEASAARSRQLVSEGHRTVLFPPDLLRRLRPFAAARDISANALARLIIETVLEDGIVDAVLDDGAAQ